MHVDDDGNETRPTITLEFTSDWSFRTSVRFAHSLGRRDDYDESVSLLFAETIVAADLEYFSLADLVLNVGKVKRRGSQTYDDWIEKAALLVSEYDHNEPFGDAVQVTVNLGLLRDSDILGHRELKSDAQLTELFTSWGWKVNQRANP